MRLLCPVVFTLFLATLCAPGKAKETTSTTSSKWKEFQGEFFTVSYPPGFKAREGIRRSPASKLPDSAFFESSDGAVEFYVYSPQWNGEPKDIEVDSEKEKETSSKTTQKGDSRIREVDISAKDGSYERSFLDVTDTALNTRKVFGIRYRDDKALKKHRPAYLKFKESLQQFAD